MEGSPGPVLSSSDALRSCFFLSGPQTRAALPLCGVLALGPVGSCMHGAYSKEPSAPSALRVSFCKALLCLCLAAEPHGEAQLAGRLLGPCQRWESTTRLCPFRPDRQLQVSAKGSGSLHVRKRCVRCLVHVQRKSSELIPVFGKLRSLVPEANATISQAELERKEAPRHVSSPGLLEGPTRFLVVFRCSQLPSLPFPAAQVEREDGRAFKKVGIAFPHRTSITSIKPMLFKKHSHIGLLVHAWVCVLT